MKNQSTKGSLRVCQGLALAGLMLVWGAGAAQAQAVARASAKAPAAALEAKETTLAEAKASLLARLQELDKEFELQLNETAPVSMAPEPIAGPASQPAAAPVPPVDLSTALLESIEGTKNPGATLVDQDPATPDLKAMQTNIATNSFLVKKIEALERMLELMETKEQILTEQKSFDKRLKTVQAKVEQSNRKPTDE